MNTLFLALTLLVVISTQAQLPTASSKAAGVDPVRLKVFHAINE